VSATTVGRWAAVLAREGVAGLARRPHTGRPPRLSERQWVRLLRQLAKGAIAAGFDTERWTLRRIALVIERMFGVRYHFRSLGPVLRRHGWSPQVPAARAAERDEALIRAWLTRDWPAVKKGLIAQGQSLPSWTRRVTRFGPPSAPRGRRAGAPPSCVA
jgi:putative transposase